MERQVILAKMLADLTLGTMSGVISLLAVGESTTITYSAVAAVLVFAGLLVREVVKAQRAVWLIVEAKDRQLAAKDAEMDEVLETKRYLRWELEKLRYTYGERTMDPGPYSARRY